MINRRVANDTNTDTIGGQVKIGKIVDRMRANPASISFLDLAIVCRHYFGEPRQHGTSHQVYRTPWQGDPRINIQNNHGAARPYQVRQVLEAIAKLAEGDPR